MTNRALQRRHDDDVLSLGARVADELLRLGRAADVVPLPGLDIRWADEAVAETMTKHTPGSAYACPACQGAAT